MKTEETKQTLNTNNTNQNTILNNGIFSNHSRLLHRSIRSYRDLYGTEISFADGNVIKSCPHFVVDDENKIKIIAYDDSNEMDQKELIESMGDRRVLISVKHHAAKPDSDPTERIKLQSTHAQLVVRSGEKVCTYNNPQDYQNGMFGSTSYPMIFIKPIFPESVTEEDVSEYEKNIILWATLLNTFSAFPGDYNGGDPLSVKSEDEVLLYGKHILKALNGDVESIKWIKRPSNHLYCAELVYLSLTLGVVFPLNRTNISQDDYDDLLKGLETSNFLSKNKNSYIKKIKLEMPRDGITALRDNRADTDVFFDSSLAVRPMLFSDMITCFVKYSVNRAKHGEASGKYQFELFQSVRPMINSMMPGILSLELESLIDGLEVVLKTQHNDYQDFKVKLAPILEAIDESVAKRSSAGNTFIPPHTFLVRSLEYEREGRIKGILAMKYFGHGVHKSLI